MTYKEKWEQMTGQSLDPKNCCPTEYFPDTRDVELCKHQRCNECWGRTYATGSNTDSVILDSGDRTKFPSGAVRDMREGKGNFSVMPLEVIREYLEDEIVGYISNFMDTRDTGELYEALVCFTQEFGDAYTLLLETAIHFEQGAKKYGPDNWRKSIPVECYIDSALRHYLKYKRGDTDERHDRAFCWNLMTCIWEVDYGPGWRDVYLEDKED